jgi:RNA polymerase sigma factor (sigma-70 family)
MPHSALATVVAQASRSIDLPSESKSTDGGLLARFIQNKDEAAFAELVRRLGPMVLGVCRRIARDRHLAEDAFQAAFIVLARRANDVRPREGVRGWLYGVAVRTAKGARAVSVRLRTHEVSVPSVPDRSAEPRDPPDADAIRILDEEVGALPDHLRVAVVMCELEGLSRKVVAERLNVPEGTLSSRLAKARKLLAERLLRRGVALPVTALGSLGLTAAAVPARLTMQTSALASTTALPPSVASLANGVIRTVFLQKLKLTVSTLFFVALAVVVARGLLPQEAAKDPPMLTAFSSPRVQQQPLEEKKSQPALKPAGTGTLLVARLGPCWVFTAEGKELPDLPLPEKTYASGRAALSPSGTHAAFVIEDIEAPAPMRPEEKPWPFKIVIQKLDDPKSAKEWEMPAIRLEVRWTADGKQLIVSKMNEVADPSRAAYENVLLDPTTGKTEKLDLPTDGRILDVGRDGKTFLFHVFDPKTKTKTLVSIVKGEDKIDELFKFNERFGPTLARLSPNGKKVLFVDADPERKQFRSGGVNQRPYLLDVATKKVELLAEFPENGQATGIAWSPDGKRIAYTWKKLPEDVFNKDTLELRFPFLRSSTQTGDLMIETEAFLMIADADGKNAKTIATDKSPSATRMFFGPVDWR